MLQEDEVKMGTMFWTLYKVANGSSPKDLAIDGQNKEKDYDPQTEARIVLIPKLT